MRGEIQSVGAMSQFKPPCPICDISETSQSLDRSGNFLVCIYFMPVQLLWRILTMPVFLKYSDPFYRPRLGRFCQLLMWYYFNNIFLKYQKIILFLTDTSYNKLSHRNSCHKRTEDGLRWTSAGFIFSSQEADSQKKNSVYSRKSACCSG